MFHLWDHRRFEEDLRRLDAGQGSFAAGDWRPAALPAGESGTALKRAFIIRGQADLARYAAPVVLFCLWLLLFRSWGLAGIYAAIIACKWFAVTTVLDNGGSYRCYFAGKKFFTGRLAS